MIPGIESLSAADQEVINKEMQQMQVQESLTTYNSLVERCFSECVTHFREKELNEGESDCVKRCIQKFMQFSQRVGLKFSEKQQQQPR
jgi:mitochondrial import inner membrane translocase subunit TIM9